MIAFAFLIGGLFAVVCVIDCDAVPVRVRIAIAGSLLFSLGALGACMDRIEALEDSFGEQRLISEPAHSAADDLQLPEAKQ